MKRLKQVGNKHIKILDQQGMKFVRYVVFDESPPAHDHHFYHHYPHYSYATLELHNFHFASKGGVRKGERGLTTG